MLDLIAKIAPLVGILGTVIGMAVSFGGIGAIVTASPTAISSGISIALRTTAYGLIISIGASIVSAAFRRCIRRAALNMGRIICGFQDINNAKNAKNS
jgi:biopolymer transport protein ExbB